ncbi:type II secretion system protein [Vibrio taketomensis]|uniref:type II secretion system protein n=1 Tax=Vibrio taketomensis TaxID=2572923 RepID=UPI00138A2FE3|nr:type II secretion system protein [Vibrio taketomensis]
MKKMKGFTLIELVVVIAILGVLAVVALPRFQNMQREARINVIETLHATFEEAHQRLYAKAQIPGALIPQGEQFWVDVNGNGIIDSDSGDYDQSTLYGKDGIDIMMINETNIDNHQLLKLVDVSDELVAVVGDQKHQAYIGFDMLGNNDIKNGGCRIYYDQKKFQFSTSGC